MVVWVGSTLHYKSAKMAFGNRSVWSSGFWWGRDALDRRFGSVCGSSIALQVDENAGRKTVRAFVWVEFKLHCEIGNRRQWGSESDPCGRVDLDREGSRQTLCSGQSAGAKLHCKSTKMGVEKSPVRSSGLSLNCITNRRKCGSKKVQCSRLDSDREGGR